MSKCRMHDCSNKVFKNGLCRKHYRLKQINKCSVEGCNGKNEVKGMCHKHYARFKRYGATKLPHQLNTKDRLYSEVRRKGTCLEWTGCKDEQGYGRMSVNGKMERTHRIVWELENGSIPEGMCVCHHCDNPCCVEISHLFLGTYQDNMQDCLQKGRGNRGGPKGEACHFAKLTEQEVLEIRASDDQCNVLAKRYDISTAIITQVQKGEIWKHLPINKKHLRNKKYDKKYKLADVDILVIQASEESNKILQKRYGVPKSTICRIRRSVGHKKPTKLTKETVLAIRASEGRNVDLAKKFNISASHISNIKRRVIWNHIQ